MVKTARPSGGGSFLCREPDPSGYAVAVMINPGRAYAGPEAQAGRRGRYARMKPDSRPAGGDAGARSCQRGEAKRRNNRLNGIPRPAAAGVAHRYVDSGETELTGLSRSCILVCRITAMGTLMAE